MDNTEPHTTETSGTGQKEKLGGFMKHFNSLRPNKETIESIYGDEKQTVPSSGIEAKTNYVVPSGKQDECNVTVFTPGLIIEGNVSSETDMIIRGTISGNIVCRLGGSCLPYLMPLFFQVVLGYSALQSGMSLIPLALSNLLAKTVAPRLLGKFGYRNIMVVNTFTIGALLASFHFVGPGTHELILLGMLALLGGANSIQFTCMNTLTLIDLPNADASSGNSLLSTIMQLSIAVSIAAASLLLDSFGGHSATSGKAVETAFHTTFATIGAIAAASSFIFALVDKDKGITRKRKKAA